MIWSGDNVGEVGALIIGAQAMESDEQTTEEHNCVWAGLSPFHYGAPISQGMLTRTSNAL